MRQYELVGLAELLRAAENPYEIFDRFLRDHGVVGWFYGFAAMPSDLLTLPYTRALYFHHTYPEDWVQAVGAGTLLDHDASLELLVNGAAEVQWEPPDLAGWMAQMRPEQRAQFEIERDLGMRFGVSLPISADPAGRVVAGLGVWHGATAAPAYRRDWEAQGATIRAAGRLLDARVRRDRANDFVGLTPRELDCLSYLAAGLRPAEICFRLGISEKTFEKHIARAKDRLRARTRDQAVAKALILNIVTP